MLAKPILAETERGHSCPHERRRDPKIYATTVRVNPILAETECERRRDAKTCAATVRVNPILAGGTGDADKSVRAPTPRSAVIASSPNAIKVLPRRNIPAAIGRYSRTPKFGVQYIRRVKGVSHLMNLRTVLHLSRNQPGCLPVGRSARNAS